MVTPFGWTGIVRVGAVQTALGAIVVLITSVLNRVMVVELGLVAAIPGALVAAHYAVQLTRVRTGFGSDRSARRSPWILTGMALSGLCGFLAAVGTALAATSRVAGLALVAVACLGLGGGIGLAGTPLLAMLAERTPPARRGPAAAVVWMMMIAGFAITAGTIGRLLDPFSLSRLVTIAGYVAVIAVAMTAAALWRLEPADRVVGAAADTDVPFRQALAALLAEPEARRFATFVLVAMLAYSAQDLILEPFAGAVFGMTPGETTRISGMQHGGTFLGMIIAAVATRRGAHLVRWAAAGCVGSAVGFGLLIAAGFAGTPGMLRIGVLAMGIANGVFAIGAIGAMMALVNQPGRREAGVRMGLYGSAQAIAFALGGFLGAALSDIGRLLLGSPQMGYAAVFLLEAMLFLGAAWFVGRGGADRMPQQVRLDRDGDALLAAVG